MALKYGFALAVVAALMLLGLHQAGMLADPASALRYALAALVLVATAGAWFAGSLQRRAEALRTAAQRVAAGEDSLRLTATPRAMPDPLALPLQDVASAVNRRFAELQSVIAQQRAIAEHGPDAMWVFDVESFRIVDANENFARLTGHPRSRLIGMTPMSIAPDTQQGMPTQAYARDLVQRALAGERLEVPWTVRRVDGTDIPCELRAIHLPAQGRTLICGLLLDVSERQRTLAELDERMRFESLITRLSAGFVRVPIEEAEAAVADALAEVGRFAQADRAYLFEFSADREQVSCTYEWCDHGIAAQLERLQALPVARYRWCLARLQRGEVVDVHDIAALPDEAAAEREEWQAESIRSILLVPVHSGSQVSGYVGFDAVREPRPWPPRLVSLLRLFGEMVSNLLARKRAQLILQAQNEDLARANAELARSNQELQQFAYVASHDLQEPLRAIGGFSGLLARRYRGKLDTKADEYLDYLTHAATRMQRMIVDLLDYSRLGREPRPFQPVALREPLDAAIGLLQAAVEEQQAGFEIDALPVVHGDATQLVQLFQNLIGNALKFRSSAPPRIRVHARREGAEWIVRVCDNGIGIDPERAGEVFQIFRRLHAQEQYPGTGIGLAVCKRIVERHRGRIWVQPGEHGGTCMCFALPAADGAGSA